MLDDPPFIGDWFSERKLGSGGFGIVTLWKNQKTKETIAIKKCHMLKGNNAENEKQRERWENEVKMMTDIKNDNIVKTVKVEPESFLTQLMKTNASGLKFLVMEYCEGGDLRRLLYKNSNCSGLKETEIRSILKSLKNAISYLHSLKITHRDIKPENIVLKQYGDITVYKITDLGYARLLNFESLNASLVGTMEYLAPELIHNGKYNNSVDYWSMGIIGFEIICGYRPFLSHASIAQWIVQVQQKKSEHICILENNNGQYTFYNQLHAENRITKCLKTHLEKWLMLALEWNPKQRGHIFELQNEITDSKMGSSTSGRPKSVTFADLKIAPVQILKIFTLLDKIFDAKILTAFCLYTYDFLSYEIDENTTMKTFYEWIEEETGIQINDIEIVLPLEQAIDSINENTKPIDLYLSNSYEKPMLYIVKKPSLSIKKTEMILSDDVKPKIPETIIDLLKHDKILLKPHVLRQFALNSYYFIKREKCLYETFIDGIKNYGLHLNHEITVFKNKISEMIKLVFGVKGSFDLHGLSVKQCKEKIGSQASDNMNMTPIFIEWDELNKKMYENLIKLSESSEKISIRYDSVLRRSRESIGHKIFEKSTSTSFDINILDKLYDHIKNEIYDRKTNEKSHTRLLQFVYHCLKQRDILLRDDDFVKLQQHLENIKIEIDAIKKTVEKAIIQAEKYKLDVIKMNNELHENVWKLLDQYKGHIVQSQIETNGYSPNEVASMLEKLNIESNTTKPTFQIGQQVNISNLKHSDLLCFGEGPDLNSLLADNESIKNAMIDLIDDGFKSLNCQYESLKIPFTQN